jgi:RES domain
VIVYRCFAWNRDARDDAADGPLWFPRIFQGEGRHDNPDVYGCLYLADRAASCIVEQLAAFRGQRLTASLLRRRGLPLALAEIELDSAAPLIDLDDPAVLGRERLRPSRVATRNPSVTQPQALDLYGRHPNAAGLQWWSIWEAMWRNVTVFDRAAPKLRLLDARELTLDHPVLLEAADLFGLSVTK